MLSFSLKAVLVAVGFVGFGCIALNNASPFWETTTLNLTIVLFVIASLAAIARRSADRFFWIGFCIVGWLYLTFSVGPWFETKIEPKLATTKLLEYAYPMLRRDVARDEVGLEGPKQKKKQEGPKQKGPAKQKQFGGAANTIGWPIRSHFKRVGHCLWAVCLAWIGGIASRYVHLMPAKENA